MWMESEKKRMKINFLKNKSQMKKLKKNLKRPKKPKSAQINHWNSWLWSWD